MMMFMIIFAAMMLAPMTAGMPKDGYRGFVVLCGYLGLTICAAVTLFVGP